MMEHKVDDTTMVKFRERLRKANLIESLFETFNKQIEATGCVLRKGTLIDSTITPSAHRPDDKGKDGKAIDPDVAWTRRDGELKHGMKVSISVDEGSEIVRQALMTPANINDAALFEDLVLGDEKKVYADKGYSSRANRDILEARKIGNGILYQGCRRKKLRGWQVSLNKRNNRSRVNVERKFAEAKCRHGMRQLCYQGIERNWIQVVSTIIVMNLKRFTKLFRPDKMVSAGADLRL